MNDDKHVYHRRLFVIDYETSRQIDRGSCLFAIIKAYLLIGQNAVEDKDSSVGSFTLPDPPLLSAGSRG